MFKIKICGITRFEDGLAAVAAGADAVGLNFYRESPRFIEEDLARKIKANLPASIQSVGVFVDADEFELAKAIERIGLDAVQLHGEEPSSILSALPTQVSIIRAFRMRENGLGPLVEYIESARSSGREPDAVLVDAYSSRSKGGTGCVVDWQRLRDERPMLGEIPLLLAGGLTPRNVADAIGLVKPDGVDAASGVEISPGIKDAALIRGFVTAAREALAASSLP